MTPEESIKFQREEFSGKFNSATAYIGVEKQKRRREVHILKDDYF